MTQKQFFIDGGFNTNADSVLVGNLDMTGHIIPTVDSDGTTGYDLGSPSRKWRDLYLSQGSLYIDGQKVIESNAGTIVVTADPDQSLTTKVTGSGVLTLQSATTVSMAATLQMGAGKKITDQGGTAVQFGDKVDMDNNQIINVGAPTADGHATTKLYVDSLVSGIATDAITEGDSEIEIADLGTGTVGITVDGGQRFALSASVLALTVPVTVNGHTLANEGYVDTAEADANTYTDQEINTATTALQSYADQSEADAKTYADGIVATATSTASTDATTKADAAQAAAIAAAATDATNKANASGTSANTYADGIVATATTALQSYADTAEADAKSYADAAIASLVDTAPGALDTLNELAAAMGDDANFAASTATNIATAKSEAIAHTDSEIAALDFNNVAGGIAVTGGDLTVGANADLELSGTSEVSYSGSTIVGDDPDAAGNPAVCASSFRPTASVSNLNLRPNAGGAISLDGGDVTYGAVGIIGNDPDNLGNPTVCASTFRPVSGQTDLNLRPGTGGAITLGGNVLEGVGTPVAGTDASNKTYVDSAESNAISTASADATSKANAAQSAAATDATTKADAAQAAAEATAAASAYTDSDVRDFLEAYDSNLVLSQSNNGIYLTSDVTDNNVVIKNNGGGAFVYATKIQPFGSSTDLEMEAKSGGKINVNGFRVYNVGTPTDSTDAATKGYVDTAEADAKAYVDTEVAALIAAAPGALDTLNELAAAMGDDANFATTVANNIATAKSGAEAIASADATAKADAAQAAAISHCETYADTAEADAISTASADATSKANAAQAAASADATSKANTAESNAALDATNKANTAESNAVGTAAADATSKANAAQSAAISAASSDATTKADAAQAAAATDATTKANAAQSAAATDATTKADAALAAAQAYTDSGIANIEASISTATFHSGVTDVTNASTLAYTFSDLVGAEDYTVYVNRQLVRPAEIDSVNLATGVVTFESSVIEVDDEIEVKGWKLVS